MRRFFALILFSTLLWTRPALAEGAATVAVVWPPNPNAEVTEALTRLHGELLSVGLKVAKSNRPASRGLEEDSRAWLGQLAVERGASAVIDVVGDDSLLALDVWVVKEEPGHFEVTRVAVEPSSANPSERIALRAIDALRGSLLELDWAGREKPTVAVVEKPPAPPPTLPPPAPPRPRFGLEAGAAMLTSFDGVGPAFMPLARVGWAARPWLLLHTTLAGAGSRPMVESSMDKTRVAQAFALVGGTARWRSDKSLWPFISLSAGALHTSLAGQSGIGTQGHDLDQWSVLLDGAVGIGLRLSQRTFLTLAAHVQVAQPYVVVHILDSQAASSGRPNLLFTLTLGTWL